MRKGYNYLPESNGRMDFSDKNTFPYPFFWRKNTKINGSLYQKIQYEIM